MSNIAVTVLGTPEQYVYPIILDTQIAMREHALSPLEALALADELKIAAEVALRASAERGRLNP